MILLDVINAARTLLQDTSTNADLRRFSDDVLLGFANQTLKRIALIRPDLFAYLGEITCTADTVVQTAPADSLRIMEVFRVKDKNAIRETSRETLDQTYPDWANDPSGDCINWMRHPRNPNRFFIYPKAPTGQILIGEYVKIPPSYGTSTPVTQLSDAYFPTVVDGVVFLAESVDNEHVNSARAKLFLDSFTTQLTDSLASHLLSDLERGALPQEDVA